MCRGAVTRVGTVPGARLLVGVSIALACAGETLAAQEITGRVLDSETRQPIATAVVSLVDSAGISRRATITTASGAFRLATERTGAIRLKVQRLGYETALIDHFVPDGERVAIEVLLDVSAIEMDSIMVRIGREPGREGFERRRALGEGFFLDPAEVRSARTWRGPGELLRNAPGFNLSFPGGWAQPWSYRGSGCLVTYIDHTRFRHTFAGGFPRNLHEELYHRDVVGVEAYAQFSDVPPDLQPLAHPADSARRCGLVIYWTRRGW